MGAEISISQVAPDAIYDLRHRVLRAGLPFESARFEGDFDENTVHLAAWDGDVIVGCAMVLLNEFEGGEACQLRGMAVDAEYRRRGAGVKLLAEVERVALEKGVKLLWANARTPAVGFYRKQGWQIVSEEFEIPTAGPHFRIRKYISTTEDTETTEKKRSH